MKKLFTILVTSAMAAQVNAGSLNLDARFDADSTDYNEDHLTGVDSGRFNMNTLRLDYKGKINDDLSFRLRTRFNKVAAAVNSTDSLTALVDYAFVAHKLSDSLTLTAGKLASEMGGFEGATAGPDLYFSSAAYSAVNLYTTGAKLGYSSDMFDLALMATNDFATTVTNQTRIAAGANAKFKLMNNSLIPMVSYHNSSDGTGSTKQQTYMTASLRYKMDEMVVDLDYDMITQKDKTTTGESDSINSIVLTYGQKFGAFKPVLKVESSTATTKTSATAETKTATTGIGAALEYYPIEGSDFRYHVAYTTRSGKADTTGSNAQTETHMLAGFRINSDFLK